MRTGGVFVLESGGWNCRGGGGGGGGGGGPTHPNRTREKTQRPDQRPFLASWGAERGR